MRRFLLSLLSAVLLLMPAISICTHSKTLLPDVGGPAMSFLHHEMGMGTAPDCGSGCLDGTRGQGDHMRAFASAVPSSLVDAFALWALGLAALAVFFAFSFPERIVARVRPRSREWIYFDTLPDLVSAFRRGIIHPKIFA